MVLDAAALSAPTALATLARLVAPNSGRFISMKCGERHTALLSQAMLRAKNPGRQTALLLPGVTSSHHSTGRLMAVIGDLGKSDETVSISVSVERQRALWLLERETAADKQVALRHGRHGLHGWLHAPRAWAGAPPASRSAVVPPACCKSTRRSLGRRMVGRATLIRGHPTDMAPQPSTSLAHWQTGRCKALPAPHPPSKTLVGTHISAQPAQHCAPTPTFATSPAFAHPVDHRDGLFTFAASRKTLLRSD